MGVNIVLALFIAAPVAIGLLLFTLARRNKQRVTRKGKAKTNWNSLVIGNCLVLLFLLSLGLLAGEIYFRFVYDTTDSINFTQVSRRWFRRYWTTRNNLGCRDNVDYYPTIAAGKRRVSFLGDSFTAGQGIKNIEHRFLNRIRGRRSDWEVHMLADLGWDTDQEIDFLKFATDQHYQFDNVVLVYCLNDVSDLLPQWTEALKSSNDEMQNVGWLLRNSYFINFLYLHWTVMRNPYAKDYYAFIGDGYRGKVWDAEVTQLHELRRLIESNGGKLMVVTWPFVNAIGPNYPYADIHKKLDDFWKAENVPHLDLLSVFKNETGSKLTINRFDAHPNEYANQLATDAIEKFVSQNLAAKP